MITDAFSSFMDKGVGQSLVKIVGIVVSLAAVYKFFIEFVESNEEAVRARNNRPDYLHVPVGKVRLSAYLLAAGGVIAVIVMTLFFNVNGWLELGILAGALVVIVVTTKTWPRTDQMALVGRGVKFKVPGWVSYKKGNMAVQPEAVGRNALRDASDDLVDIEINYEWSRVKGNPVLLWRSVVEITDLQGVLNNRIKASVQNHVMSTKGVATLSIEGKLGLEKSIREECAAKFYELGVELHSLRIGHLGIDPLARVAIAIERSSVSATLAGVLSASLKKN